ncbi:ATPase [Mycobacteroides saopaulense]|uniref:ATPase n=1 Tax=Mycobacteroides saopaulense TaxID=1578165 RepID=UPI000A9D348F|nr:ATPase [Mycobacteroides saopaulense]
MVVDDTPEKGSQTASRTGRERIQKLARAALNADVTVEQLDTVLTDMSAVLIDMNETLGVIGELTPRMMLVVERMENVMTRIERIVGLAESVLAPVTVTESAVRGVLVSFQKEIKRRLSPSSAD